jgi:hypothetical protein
MSKTPPFNNGQVVTCVDGTGYKGLVSGDDYRVSKCWRSNTGAWFVKVATLAGVPVTNHYGDAESWYADRFEAVPPLSTYNRETYDGLLRHEVIAPAVKNDGTISGYPDALAAALTEASLNWTAVDTIGCWNGKIEPGRQFTIFAPAMMRAWQSTRNTADVIGSIARDAMPDQDAIQVVVDCPVRLIEA